MRSLIFTLGFFASVRAFAFSAGITGKSGAGGGATCTECHSGGVTPTVRINGPGQLLPGETATYSIDIVSAATPQKSAGLDLKASAGTLAPDTPGIQLQNGELTHTMVLTGSSVTVQFKLTAPQTSGNLTLSLAALSSNGSGTTGDGTAALGRTIAVETAEDLAGADLAGADFSRPEDLTPPVDAVSSATTRAPLPGDEPRWACDCRFVAASRPRLAPVLLLALFVLMLRGRDRRSG
jgi:hypothetical protein